MLTFVQDPCVITNVTNYEPYEKMKQVRANIVWPSDFTVPANSSDEDGSILGYVCPVSVLVSLFSLHSVHFFKA